MIRRAVGGGTLGVARVAQVAFVASITAACAAALHGARDELGLAPLWSARGLFAACASAQVLLFAMLVTFTSSRAVESLRVALSDTPTRALRDDPIGFRVRIWLVAWMLALVALRAALAGS